MNGLRQRVREALGGVTPFDFRSRIEALVNGLSPSERTAHVVSNGLLETGVDAEQYFWMAVALEFLPKDPAVLAAARTLLRRHDPHLANHTLIELLADAEDRSAITELIPFIERQFENDEQESLSCQALQTLFFFDKELALALCEKHNWFKGRPNLEFAARELNGEEVDDE
jgi:hypothetical protein